MPTEVPGNLVAVGQQSRQRMSTLPLDLTSSAQLFLMGPPPGGLQRRGRPATYPPAVPDIEYLGHFRETRLVRCYRNLVLHDLLWLTLTHSVVPAKTTNYICCPELLAY